MELIKFRNQSGMANAALIFLCLVIGAPLYFAYRIVPFYYNYYELIGLMEAEARVASEYTDVRIREIVIEKIRNLNIPIQDERDFQLNRSARYITMYLAYTEELWVTVGKKDYKLWEFPFVAEVEREY